MGRTTAGIMRINKELEKISGLDGIVADMVEQKESEIKGMVEDILENHPNATIFDYAGDKKDGQQTAESYDYWRKGKYGEKDI